MSLVSDGLDSDVVAPSRRLLFLVTRRALKLHGPAGRECGLPELLLLEKLASRDGRGVAATVEEVADLTGTKPGKLRAFVDKLLGAGVIEPALQMPPTPSETSGAIDERNLSATDVGTFALVTPIVLALGPDGFEEYDHDGAVRARLSARDLLAACAFRTSLTYADGFAAQRELLGNLALDERSFESMIRRLQHCQLLQRVDEGNLAFRRGTVRVAARSAWESRGKKALAESTAREAARLDAIEAERRARLGTSRTKVLPICAQRTAWRMPPLSLGMIMAYAIAYKDGILEELFDFRPDFVIDEAKLDAYSAEPVLCMFSSYVWSSTENLALSARAKEKNPLSLMVHGGPNVPKYERDTIVFFELHPHVDIVVHGEGEVTAAEMLEALAPQLGGGQPDLSVLNDVAGLSYRAADGSVVRTASRDRITDLDTIPSPYLTGLFDSFAEGWRELIDEAGTEHFTDALPAAIIESNRGCPYGCTFCDWGSATLSRIRQFSIDRVFDEIEWCARNRVDALAMADANFGIFARDVDITTKVADCKRTIGFPHHFGTNYAKNTVKHLKQIVETLAEVDILGYGLLSLQSMDDDTLATIKRSNIKLDRYEELAREFQQAGLPLYVDLMMGLPGQTVRSFAADLQECVNREVHAKIFPTILLVNSPMNEPAYRELNGITALPGERVLESSSFTREDWDEMMHLRRVFMVLEKYGVLRFVARYIRQETGLREVDFIRRLIEDGRADPGRWPVINFTVEEMFRWMVPPASWKALLDEVREYAVTVLGVVPDDALDTVIDVQHALLPSRGRQFPCTVELEHDFVGWHAQMLDAKYEGHYTDWETIIPALRTLPPGTLTVDDPRNVCIYELGVNMEDSPWEAWDLSSPISRAVSSQA